MVESIENFITDFADALLEIGTRLSFNWQYVTANFKLSGLDPVEGFGSLDSMLVYANLSVFPLIEATGDLIADIGAIMGSLADILLHLT